MKKVIFTCAAFLCLAGFASKSYAQLQDEKNVTITMDLQPILQLDMSTPDQIDFVFDDIADYYGGITKYGATILKISSTVNWDLWAVGTSQANMSGAANNWDVQMQYGFSATSGGVSTIPLSALELHQHAANTSSAGLTGTQVDYSLAFQEVTTAAAVANPGQNSIFYANAAGSIYTIPAVTEKFIQGGTLNTDFVAGGSYLTPQMQTPAITTGLNLLGAYYNVIDYRILPGLPVVFPCAGLNDGTSEAMATYAQPGVYSMNVKYILCENQ